MKTLQSWVGLVESVAGETFVARITDEKNSANPIEEVELPVDEVSASDRSLLQVGATFYWSIGYETSRDGQLRRVSAIRFARQPNMSAFEEARVLREAEALAAVLQSD